MSQSRQLAAIMFTDIVGYTKLMGEDEQKAFELLKKNRSVQRSLIENFNGRWLKEMGDGVLASFSTVSDAIYCAKEIQKTCQDHPDLNLRIGIHQGEVVFEGDDVFGDDPTVNKLEAIAAAMTGKESALFVPSGTFGNQLCLFTHCNSGDEVILDKTSHIVEHEAGASGIIARVQLRIIEI